MKIAGAEWEEEGREGGRERLRLGRTAQQMKSGQRAEKPRMGREGGREGGKRMEKCGDFGEEGVMEAE